jgi:hypothetical protein
MKTTDTSESAAICAVYPSGASDAAGERAVNYVHANFDEKYDINTDRSNSDVWYCTKLAWRAWQDVGYNMDNEASYWLNWTGALDGKMLAQYIADSPMAVHVGLNTK